MTVTHTREASVRLTADGVRPALSIVIPLFNEVETIPMLAERLATALDRLGRSWEVIVVDDGSTDGSFEALARVHAADPRFTVIQFRRNFGQTPAFMAGFDAARGGIVVTMDADLQNDPDDIGAVVVEMERGGYDIVSGWRQDRKEPLLRRRIPSLFGNWVMGVLTGVRLKDTGCSLKAYRSEVVKNIKLYGNLHRFVPAAASWYGVTIGQVPVRDNPRAHGTSKYGLGIKRAPRVLLDLLTLYFLRNFGTRPIHIFGGIGIVSGLLGVLVGLYLTVVKLVYDQNIGDRPLLLLAVLLVILGVNFLSMGFLGELVVRSYHEAQDKPIYTVRRVLDAAGDPTPAAPLRG
ncbi:MAG: glycosyltransferase family 2 protein [Ardenticatenales bacterium]|jgi:glycosyltransferase involved in cell wall biosynthesis|nr:glycosyltransferase family 2 protein [Ardenticatenales bacterium]